jgi:hypothetical protein
LVCNNSIHSINCKYHNNNALKGAAQQPKQLVFNKSELNIVSKTLELCRYFIGKNQNQYQNPQDILKELSTSINILSARRQNNNNSGSNLKGASDNPFKSLDNIRNMVGLGDNKVGTQLKGASSNNNICSKKEHLKDLLKQFNLI